MSNKYRVGFKLMRLLVATALLLGACVDAVAHDQIPAPPQSRPIVIRGATLHRVDGPTMDAADLLFIDGKITAIGREIQLPPKTQVIDGQGQHVYPGLFESSTDLGLREINAVGESVDSDEFGDLNPNARSWVAFNPDS
ncbi:MAG: amidohydrolase, partial [Planctomycetota bacterium]